MTAEATSMDGVKLTSVTINAASPDVVGALMQQITQAVLKAIPEGTIEKVAGEIIAQGAVIYRRQTSGYRNETEEVRYELSGEAKKQTIELLKKEIERQVHAYLGETAVQIVVAQAVASGVAGAINELPQFAAKLAAERMGYTMMGQFDAMGMSVQNRLEHITDVLRKTQQALMSKGTLQSYEVPLA